MKHSFVAIVSIATFLPVIALDQAPSTTANDDRTTAPTDETVDPAVPSAKIKEALDMIRRVEELDKLAAEVERLRTANARLQEDLKKETMSLPLIVVKSKAISATDAVAILEIDGKKRRVRLNSANLISIKEGDATPLLVKRITPDTIEIELPELQRTLVLND